MNGVVKLGKFTKNKNNKDNINSKHTPMKKINRKIIEKINQSYW